MQDQGFIGFPKHMSKCYTLSEEEESAAGCKGFLEEDLPGLQTINEIEVIAEGGGERGRETLPFLVWPLINNSAEGIRPFQGILTFCAKDHFGRLVRPSDSL